jgi:hypothetical protein
MTQGDFMKTSRRDYLKVLTAGAGLAAASGAGCGRTAEPNTEAAAKAAPQPPPDHERRIQWWRDSKFGMFIHWGLYSQLGRQEWVMALEDIPVEQYEKMAKGFRPKPNPAGDWAKLAKQAGMKYMVMTTKHHEGFCNFDSKLTDYCATKQGPGRDLVKEYVEAARAEGLRVGFYYSLMDWHHPDGMKAKDDPAARRRFVDYIHGQIRELMTNYGKIDILWYDVAVPLDPAGWESEKMNQMVLQLQPDIIVNNRNWLAGDFSTPEQTIAATKGDWESCMTLNDSWGYTARRRQLEDAATDCSQPGAVRAGRRQLSAQHRSQGGRVDPRTECADPQRGRQVDAEEQHRGLRNAEIAGEPVERRRIHAQRKHVVHARVLLAREQGDHRWHRDEAEVGEAAGQR